MSTLNRRQWLRRAGWGSALGMLGAATGLPARNWDAVLDPPAEALANTPASLCFNENPWGPSAQVRQAISAGFDECCRYPMQFLRPLLQTIAEREGVRPEQVVITGGSAEGLKMAGLVFGLERGEVIAPDPTYQALMSYAERMGAYIHRVGLTEELNHDLPAMEERITGNTRLIFVCNPNNPTGVLINPQELRDFVLAVDNRSVVFLDEAYIDYVENDQHRTGVDLVKAGHNVIVSRTFSKVYGLAGLRIGYLIAREDIAQRLIRYRMAGVSMPAIRGAEAALAETDFYQESLQRNREAKAFLYQQFEQLGLRYLPSHTNFVFFESGRDIRELNRQFLEKGVKVGRPFPPLTEWCRISTGRMEDVERFGQALRQLMG